ncbi:KxYKxGKxW signal peptide domain-containing protein [Weissella sagaensis]|uniref:KxYKxGKxW signal peptide domain-containing protein n=1 Tax=Weissella sagaensis TaxID=2559928 RepID=A0ABW1RTM5_9LACO|nr:KxYKxGKxW signal peptide domain-containing protein [Weissella sagaensis]
MGQNKIHYKMYKDGKKWVFTGLAVTTISIGLTSMDINVYADQDITTVGTKQFGNIDGKSLTSEAATTEEVVPESEAAATEEAVPESEAATTEEVVEAATTEEVVSESEAATTEEVVSESEAATTEEVVSESEAATTEEVVPESEVAATEEPAEKSAAAVTGLATPEAGLVKQNHDRDSIVRLSYKDAINQLADINQDYTKITKDNFLDFFVLNKDASYDKKNGIVTLTKNRQDQVGNFTLKNKINLDYDFTLSGSVNLGANASGADGIGIAFHDGKTSDVGISGGNLGIAGLENAFGFKLDSWYNSATRPNSNATTESNKFGWDKDPVRGPFGSFVTTTYKKPQGGRDNVWWAETEQQKGKNGYQILDRNIYDGDFHYFLIDYNGNSHRMTITLKQRNNFLVWEQEVDVNNFNNKLAAFMMSGSTGGATNLQQFRIDEFNYVAGQTAYVHYFDKTTGEELSVDEVTGQSGSTIEYTTSNEIDNYENKGYILDSDEFTPGSVFDNDISVDQNYAVYFVHGVTPVNPDNPQEPGTPINPENPDGPKWPDGSDQTSLTADVNQTIHYQYADGTMAAADKTDAVHFTHQIQVDKVTGEIVQDDGWQAVDGKDNFDSKESPVIAGYTPSQANSEAVDGLTYDSQDNEQTIIYMANEEKAQVSYIDDTTGDVISADQLSGAYGTTDDYRTVDKITGYENQGYELVSDNYPTDGVVYDQAGGVKQYEVHFVHGVTPVNPDNPQEPGTPINPEDPDGPKWPDGTDKTSLTADVHQTIHYQYADGTMAAADKTDAVHFTHQIQVDKVTGEIVQDDGWQAVDGKDNFDSKESPVIAGYTSSQANSAVVDGLTYDSQDNEQTIIYTMNQEPGISIKPDKPNNPKDVIKPNSESNSSETLNEPNVLDETTSVFGQATSQTIFDQSLQEKSQTTIAGENKRTDKPDLPQTGVHDSQYNTKKIGVSILSILAILLSLVGLGSKKNFDD